MNKTTITLRRYVVVAVVFTLTGVSSLSAEDLFDRECVTCHVRKKVSLRKAFMNALLVYGGEENMKAGLLYYFQNPRREISIMDEAFIRERGVKKPLKIETSVLKKALDIYWDRYTVMGRLR